MKDRTEYEEWFAGLSGEYKAGAYHWVVSRSIPAKAFCDGQPGTDYTNGCLHASERFGRIDYRRLHDPEYKLGWNSYIPTVNVGVPAVQAEAAPVRPKPTVADCVKMIMADDRLDCFDHLTGGDSPSNAPASYQVAAAAVVPPKSAAPSKVQGEEQEDRFISVIVEAKTAYENASNGMLKGATRPTRGRNICEVLPESIVKGWTGAIYALSSNADGHGVVVVKVSRDIYLHTFNNDFSDAGSGTLIKNGSPLFREVSQLNVGQRVRFSGSFFKSEIVSAHLPR